MSIPETQEEKDASELVDARFRITELEAYNASRTDELMAATKRITELEHQLAEVTRERDQNGINYSLEKADNTRTKEQLAAAQAREQQLRDALRCCWNTCSITGEANELASNALATKPDDSPLRAYVAKEQAKMLREMVDDAPNVFARNQLRNKIDELEAQFK